jgi:tRNA(Arg) A34 adenosine deaminase TadA
MPSKTSRRVALRRVVALVASIMTARVAAQMPTPEGGRPSRASHGAFMERAFELRRRAIERGDQPYGAVVVKDGSIVGEGVSAVVTDRDPTAHAEMQAIRDAARRLGTGDLSGCVMYGTSKACPMCEAAAYWARISRMYYGASVADAGPPRLP